MKIGYVRVSSFDQNEVRQVEALRDEGVLAENLFIDKQSGKNTDRPELQKMLTFARAGDEIIVLSLDRLARNTKDLLSIIEDLDNRKITLKSLSNKELDTSSATGKLIITILGAVAEMERTNILERQKQGIEIAKKNGVYKGTTPLVSDEEFIKVYKRVEKRELKTSEAMSILKYSKSGYHTRVRKLREEGKI